VPTEARAFWIREPGRGEIRPVRLPEPGPDEVLVRTLRSGLSRGTKVCSGAESRRAYDVMRAPFQEGDFPGPVKYGYLNVGSVDRGPDELRGRTVFCLFPHPDGVRRTCRRRGGGLPDDVPPERAVLTGTVERPRSTPYGTPRPRSATGSRSSAPAGSGASSPGRSGAFRERR
jgi:hypothetical protein